MLYVRRLENATLPVIIFILLGFEHGHAATGIVRILLFLDIISIHGQKLCHSKGTKAFLRFYVAGKEVFCGSKRKEQRDCCIIRME